MSEFAWRCAARTLVISAIVSCVALAGCDSVKQAIGLQPTAPDEFAVESQPPLAIPPDFNLRPPEPGVARPQAVKTDTEAKKIFMEAGPGKPESNTADAEIARALARLAELRGNPNGPVPSDEVQKDSLASKLLEYSGTGAAVEKRETKVLNGVY